MIWYTLEEKKHLQSITSHHFKITHNSKIKSLKFKNGVTRCINIVHFAPKLAKLYNRSYFVTWCDLDGNINL